jgi:protein-L-isoaspartate O-methyltransferase
VCSKEVYKALQVCSRDIFAPEDQQDEAFEDRPLRLDREFNISAPRAFLMLVRLVNSLGR